MMPLVAQDDGSGVFQLIFVAFIGVMWLVSYFVKKARRQQQTMQTRPGERPAPRPTAADALSQVRKFFESMQQQVEPPSEPRMATAVKTRRPRRQAKAVPVKAPEKPEKTESFSRRIKWEDTESPDAARGAGTTRRVGLERVVANPRLSAAARAIVLSEIVGSPTALRPHRSPFEME